jgi:hypothetical protein
MVCQDQISKNFSTPVPLDEFFVADFYLISVPGCPACCRRQRRFSAYLIWLRAFPDFSVAVHTSEMSEWQCADTSGVMTIGAGHLLQPPDRRPQKPNSASEKDGKYNSVEALGKRLKEPRREAYSCETT